MALRVPAHRPLQYNPLSPACLSRALSRATPPVGATLFGELNSLSFDCVTTGRGHGRADEGEGGVIPRLRLAGRVGLMTCDSRIRGKELLSSWTAGPVLCTSGSSILSPVGGTCAGPPRLGRRSRVRWGRVRGKRLGGGQGCIGRGEIPPPPFQGAQPLPSHCLPTPSATFNGICN